MSNEPRPGRPVVSRFLAALQYGDFQTLWTANFFAGAAAWALIVARGWVVYELADSYVWVGLVTFAAMIPRVVVSIFTGYLADRFDRRRLLTAMFAVNFAHNIALGILMLTGNAEIWHLVVLSVVNGSARAAQMPAGQSLIANLVPRHLLLNAIALNQATMHGSRLVGPLAIAPLLSLGDSVGTGAAGAVFLCSGFYAVSLVQSMRIRTATTGHIDRRQSILRNFAAGAVYVYKTPMMRAIVGMAFFHCGLTMSFESLLPALSSEQLDAQGSGFALLMMGVGGGALISAMTLAGVESEVTKGKLFLVVGLLSGLAPCALALAPTVPLALIGAFFMGLGQAAFMTLTHTMIQSVVPDGIRGRVAGIYSVHIGGIMASANLFNARFVDYISIDAISSYFSIDSRVAYFFNSASLLLIGGGLLFLGVVFLSWWYSSTRQIYQGQLFQRSFAAAD